SSTRSGPGRESPSGSRCGPRPTTSGSSSPRTWTATASASSTISAPVRAESGSSPRRAQATAAAGLALLLLSAVPPATGAWGAAREPIVLDWAAPVYPAIARQARVSGRVVVALPLDADGRPTDVA